MYSAEILDNLRKHDIGMSRQSSTPRGFLPPETVQSLCERKPPVTDTQIQSLKQIIKICVVELFCGNVVAVRKKSDMNRSLFASRMDINIIEAMKAVSETAEAMLTDIMRSTSPPTQHKEVFFVINRFQVLYVHFFVFLNQFAPWFLSIYNTEKGILVSLMRRVSHAYNLEVNRSILNYGPCEGVSDIFQ